MPEVNEIPLNEIPVEKKSLYTSMHDFVGEKPHSSIILADEALHEKYGKVLRLLGGPQQEVFKFTQVEGFTPDQIQHLANSLYEKLIETAEQDGREDDLKKRLMRHEATHALQMRRYGVNATITDLFMKAAENYLSTLDQQEKNSELEVTLGWMRAVTKQMALIEEAEAILMESLPSRVISKHSYLDADTLLPRVARVLADIKSSQGEKSRLSQDLELANQGKFDVPEIDQYNLATLLLLSGGQLLSQDENGTLRFNQEPYILDEAEVVRMIATFDADPHLILNGINISDFFDSLHNASAQIGAQLAEVADHVLQYIQEHPNDEVTMSFKRGFAKRTRNYPALLSRTLVEVR